MAILIINSTYVIEQTFTNDNVDPQLIKDNYIYVTQLETIKPALGNDFYDDLIAEVASGTYTGLNETLVNDYIKPALAFKVKAKVLPELRMRTTNKGVMINLSETSESATKEEVSQLQEIASKMGDDLLDEMRRYMTDNSASFTEYVSNESDTKLVGGIIIPKA